MAQAANEVGGTPRDLSFKGTLQTMKEFAERLLSAHGQTQEDLYVWLLLAIGAHQVNDRPNRIEPRARKRRRKQYPRLMQPRHVAQSSWGQSVRDSGRAIRPRPLFFPLAILFRFAGSNFNSPATKATCQFQILRSSIACHQTQLIFAYYYGGSMVRRVQEHPANLGRLKSVDD
jgi:hypothetical protein